MLVWYPDASKPERIFILMRLYPIQKQKLKVDIVVESRTRPQQCSEILQVTS